MVMSHQIFDPFQQKQHIDWLTFLIIFILILIFLLLLVIAIKLLTSPDIHRSLHDLETYFDTLRKCHKSTNQCPSQETS